MIHKKYDVALVGARGYVGAEMIRILCRHPQMNLTYASSGAVKGKSVRSEVPEYMGDLAFVAPSPEGVVDAGADVVILAMPNGQAAPYVAALDASGFDGLILDLGADYRFDDAWVYAIPELDHDLLPGAKRIANPGCYATAAQLAIAPLNTHFTEPPRIFGVSGYSGAGTSPSRKNDPKVLKDNLMPYALVGHGHEKEMARRAGGPVHFTPHVAQFFRGLSITMDVVLDVEVDQREVYEHFEKRYGEVSLVRVRYDVAEIQNVAGTPFCDVGGFAVAEGGRRVVIVSVLDNLLKGAASQAMQNINIALGINEFAGLDLSPASHAI